MNPEMYQLEGSTECLCSGRVIPMHFAGNILLIKCRVAEGNASWIVSCDDEQQHHLVACTLF